MDELIGRITARTGITDELAKQAVSTIVTFLNRAAPPEKTQRLFEGMPEARDYIAAPAGGGGAGGMMGAMAAMNEMTSAGLSMNQVQDVTKETVRYAKERAGEDTVNDVIGSIPGLGQFV